MEKEKGKQERGERTREANGVNIIKVIYIYIYIYCLEPAAFQRNVQGPSNGGKVMEVYFIYIYIHIYIYMKIA